MSCDKSKVEVYEVYMKMSKEIKKEEEMIEAHDPLE